MKRKDNDIPMKIQERLNRQDTLEIYINGKGQILLRIQAFKWTIHHKTNINILLLFMLLPVEM